mgnify:CR=1 FL=1
MVKITSIHGNKQKLDGGSMFGNAPRALWERWTPVDDQGRIPLACRCLLIETDQYKILCETGIGAFFEPKKAERFGVETPERHILLENLEKLNIHPDDIDYVILSHLHFDHAGGLLPPYSQIEKGHDDLLFSKATYVVGENAWQRALNPHFRDRASFVPSINEKLKESGRLHIVKDLKPPKELSSFISFFESSGHTPGQLHTVVHGDKKSVVFAGDLIPGAPWVHLPITMGYDRFPEKVIEEKQKLYADFESKDWQVFFTHDSNYAMGSIKKNEKGKFESTNLESEFVAQPI